MWKTSGPTACMAAHWTISETFAIFGRETFYLFDLKISFTLS